MNVDQSPDFCPLQNTDIYHGFFGRQGGVSGGLYESLNCGEGSKDSPQDVQANRALVTAKAGLEEGNVLSLYQIHSNKCVYVTKTWDKETRPEADSMVTDLAGFGLGILTADCAPVLFHGRKKGGSPVIGAAHAGWKGALAGVMENTINALEDLGAEKHSIHACVGPCIGPQSYEVSAEFKPPFMKQDPQNERFFRSVDKSGHLMFNLPDYCLSRLKNAGISNAFALHIDTYSAETKFFSYRRTTHRNETDYGRQISLIAIKTEKDNPR